MMDDARIIEAEMHGIARLHVALARMDGYRFDKKLLRFNEIVDTAFRYGRCGVRFSWNAAWLGLGEAIEASSPDIPAMYSGKPVTSLCPEWMLSAPDPRLTSRSLRPGYPEGARNE